MTKVNELLFEYFIVSLVKLILPIFQQVILFANCFGKFTMILNSVQTY